MVMNPIILETRWLALAQLPELPVTDTRLDDAALFAACAAVERLPFWTLTFNAKDQPGLWCARLGFGFGPVEITQNAVLGATRAECEARIPLMSNGRWSFVRRCAHDEPQIVGVWL